MATATGVSIKAPKGWEAYSVGVLNALADPPPARVAAAARVAKDSPAAFLRKRAAHLEAIAIGPGGRPYTISVGTVALVNGKDDDLERFKAEKADILTWPTGLGQAKVIAYYLEDPNIVTVEAHVRRGDKIIAIAAVGPQVRISGRLLKEALPTLRLV